MKDLKTADLVVLPLYMNLGTFLFLVALGKLPHPDVFINDQPLWEPETTYDLHHHWGMRPDKPLPALLEKIQEAGRTAAESKQNPSDVSFKEFSVLLAALNKGKALAHGRYIAGLFDFLLNDARPSPDYRKEDMPFWHASTTVDYIVLIGQMLGFRVDCESVLAGLVRVEYVVREVRL